MSDAPRKALISRLLGSVQLICPVCAGAAVLTLAIAAGAIGAITLDHTRSLQQADLGARYVADRASQHIATMLARIDGSLRSVATAAADGAGGAVLNTLISGERRGAPRLLAFYVIGRNGEAIAASTAGSLRNISPLPACLLDARIEPGQLQLRPITLPLAGAAGVLPAICAMRGIPVTSGGVSAIVAVIGQEALQSRLADLLAGPRSFLSLSDETGQLLAQIDLLRRADGAPARPRADIALAYLSAPSRVDLGQGAIVLTRRIDAPIAATLVAEIVQPEIVDGWWRRSALLGSTATIVIAFLWLAALAVRRCERREAARLQQLVDLTTPLAGPQPGLPPAHDAVLAQLIADAQKLVPCAIVADHSAGTSGDLGPHARAPLQLQRLQPDLVQIGPVRLRRTGALRFTDGDLALLRLRTHMAEASMARGEVQRVNAGALEQQLHAVEQVRAQLETVFGEMSEATFTLDAAWRFTVTNRAAERLFEEYPQDLHDRVIWEIFPELTGSLFESECRRAARERHPVSFELHWMRSDHWLIVHVYPRETAGGRAGGVAVYLQDITNQVAADDKLREAAKMEAMGRLTGGIAHDYNNLLTVILGNTEMLDVELPDSVAEYAELRDMLAQITRAAQNAAELTHQLLAFARRQTLAPRDLDIGRLVQGLDGLLRRSLGAAISLEIRSPASLWQAHVDATQLESAIVNLVINARDAMPQGGRLSIETANLTIRKSDADQLGNIGPGNYVVISVSDTGHGIPKDVLGKVFEPFFSTKPTGRGGGSGRGAGLGLSMVYGFVTQSGGQARITSEVGRGTTVRLYLPAVREAAADSASPPGKLWQPDPVLPGGSETILLVEDSEMVRQYAEAVLTGLGYQVYVAEDGPSALAMCEHGVLIDLLLSDVLLPNGMDGVDLADRIQALSRKAGRPVPRVLFMSGYVDSADAHQDRLQPQVNLLLKPFRRAALASMVRARLDAAPA